MDSERANEIRRITGEYARRGKDATLAGLYSPLSPGNLHITQSLDRELLKALRAHATGDLSSIRLLDVGCGDGRNLWRLIGYGFHSGSCVGIDLLPDRVARARQLLPMQTRLLQGDASVLPFEDAEFDLVVQFTVFSSILNDAVCRGVAREMFRVLKPGGLVFSYDFWLNPFNKQTRGITPAFLKDMFPGANSVFHRITLAPPIVRRVARFSWTIATALEAMRIFNTHYLAVIQKPSQ